MRTGWLGLALVLGVALPCLVLSPWSLRSDNLDGQRMVEVRQSDGAMHGAVMQAPGQVVFGVQQGDAVVAHRAFEPFGTDEMGRSLFWRCLVGGLISLGIGLCAALLSVVIGTLWGALSGYAGGRVDALMMRVVDVLQGLPYLLLVVMVSVAVDGLIDRARSVEADGWVGWLGQMAGAHPKLINLVVLVVAIGGVSWLTMARVIRGQVLSLRTLPYIEAARAAGAGPKWVFVRHLLPGLIGPVVVYATLAVPQAILQESFLSFLGIGVQPPLPSWGGLASDGVKELAALGVPGLDMRWWLPLFPCLLLALTLLGLNFLGDALREKLDPRSGK